LGLNSVMLPFYGLSRMESVNDFVAMMAVGFREMIIPTCYMTMIYFLMKGVLGNWFQEKSWRLVLVILILIGIVLLSEFAWSAFIAQDGLRHFVEFWGFYFLWTLFACILIPLLDRFYSKRASSASRQGM
jgi:hypothetical protein